MTLQKPTSESLNAIAARYHAAPKRELSAPDALSDLVVVPALREAIVGNLLAPGSRLLEIQLAGQLGVSRTPVREAFAQLEREGLVTIIARVGVFVREVTVRDVDEIYTVRAALEGLAVELAARNMDDLGRARLNRAVEAMKAKVEADDPVGYTQELDAFYATVMSLAENVVLHRTHDGLLGPVRRLRRIAMSHKGRMKASFEQTVRIKDALLDGDLTCVELMREQLANACQAAKDELK
ncbi:MAG TPA: GntR family transcriptional regulator [Burkholderiaceae bacterium]|jgi:DNA-binding GntR family transcriptional regulator